jgi:hypothetical protein
VHGNQGMVSSRSSVLDVEKGNSVDFASGFRTAVLIAPHTLCSHVTL